MTQTTKDAMSDRLMAFAAENPLRILGPEFFDEALKGLYRQKMTRDMNASSGMIVATIANRWEFFWRDPKARASYIYASLVGLIWPSPHPENEKRRLRQKFEEGWESGELRFLSDVPREELELYRGKL